MTDKVVGSLNYVSVCNYLHRRWIPIYFHPALLVFIFRPLFEFLSSTIYFRGDENLLPKSDPEWVGWPRVVLSPQTPGPNGHEYEGWYWLIYIAEKEPFARCKLFPVQGLVAPRIGDGAVSFRAVTLWGCNLHLHDETSGKDLSQAQLV